MAKRGSGRDVLFRVGVQEHPQTKAALANLRQQVSQTEQAIGRMFQAKPAAALGEFATTFKNLEQSAAGFGTAMAARLSQSAKETESAARLLMRAAEQVRNLRVVGQVSGPSASASAGAKSLNATANPASPTNAARNQANEEREADRQQRRHRQRQRSIASTNRDTRESEEESAKETARQDIQKNRNVAAAGLRPDNAGQFMRQTLQEQERTIQARIEGETRAMTAVKGLQGRAIEDHKAAVSQRIALLQQEQAAVKQTAEEAHAVESAAVRKTLQARQKALQESIRELEKYRTALAKSQADESREMQRQHDSHRANRATAAEDQAERGRQNVHTVRNVEAAGLEPGSRDARAFAMKSIEEQEKVIQARIAGETKAMTVVSGLTGKAIAEQRAAVSERISLLQKELEAVKRTASEGHAAQSAAVSKTLQSRQRAVQDSIRELEKYNTGLARSQGDEEREQQRQHDRHRQRQRSMAASNRATQENAVKELEASNQKIRNTDKALIERSLQLAEGASRAARGFAMLGLLGEAETQKILKGLIKIQAAFDVFVGTSRTILGAVESLRMYSDLLKSVGEAKMAQSALGALATRGGGAVASGVAGAAGAAAAGRAFGTAGASAAGSAVSSGIGRTVAAGAAGAAGAGAVGAVGGTGAVAGTGAIGTTLLPLAAAVAAVVAALGAMKLASSKMRDIKDFGLTGGSRVGGAFDTIGSYATKAAAPVYDFLPGRFRRSVGGLGMFESAFTQRDTDAAVKNDPKIQVQQGFGRSPFEGVLDQLNKTTTALEAAEKLRAKNVESRQMKEETGEFLGERRSERVRAQGRMRDIMNEAAASRFRPDETGQRRQQFLERQVTSRQELAGMRQYGNTAATRLDTVQTARDRQEQRTLGVATRSEDTQRARAAASREILSAERGLTDALRAQQDLLQSARQSESERLQAAQDVANAQEKYVAAQRQVLTVQQQITRETRAGIDAAIQGIQQEIGMRRQAAAAAQQRLTQAKERFADLEPAQQQRVLLAGQRLRASEKSVTETGLTTGESATLARTERDVSARRTELEQAQAAAAHVKTGKDFKARQKAARDDVLAKQIALNQAESRQGLQRGYAAQQGGQAQQDESFMSDFRRREAIGPDRVSDVDRQRAAAIEERRRERVGSGIRREDRQLLEQSGTEYEQDVVRRGKVREADRRGFENVYGRSEREERDTAVRAEQRLQVELKDTRKMEVQVIRNDAAMIDFIVDDVATRMGAMDASFRKLLEARLTERLGAVTTRSNSRQANAAQG